ncbi:Glycosyltransferases involved in cell wall biogenesis [Sulfolobus islandicus LAL14/1]|uniref:Glycosyltransferases involved in cell wall biogenesis n=1 Tax=Saccharolobus islandicus LAL14/1 TaxID=1241935 RepID=M9UCP0_SACIS|nr:Glycosyltransferases involved in cell wall biogenesis [Sulfolobus islandicus LAL14/1]
MRNKWKFIYSKNKWIGPKVLEALKESTGEVIVFLKDDDLFEQNKLKTIYNIFKENSNLGFYRHKVKIINEYGREAKLPK